MHGGRVRGERHSITVMEGHSAHPDVAVTVDVDPCHILREVDRAFDEFANRHLYVKSVCARAGRGVSVRGMHGGWVGSGVSAAAVVWKMRRGLT